MALFVNTNLASLNAQRNLAGTSSLVSTSLERLSSGLRINNAYDDSAGLAIADKLARDVRVVNQAIRNANDGLSALAIGDKALGTITDIVTRDQNEKPGGLRGWTWSEFEADRLLAAQPALCQP